ncbi:MAG: energy-coupling factor transporter transmembrane component T [Synergistaceae bacterium]|nr:energy-coupling factor transporter transmembrane component T [Synergistaceae bacterium]
MVFAKGISFGQYIPAPSYIHGLDPRCKIIAVLVSMAAIFMTSSPYAMCLWGALLPAVVMLSKIPMKAMLRSIRPVFILIIFTAALHLFWSDGVPIFKAGPVVITDKGCLFAVQVSMRLLFLILYASILTLTTSPSELSDGMELLLSPLGKVGFPVHETAMMMTIALRFIPTLFEETDRIMKAQISRGANFETGGAVSRIKSYIPVLVPMLALVFQRADTLATAMEARCYRGGRGRVRMAPLRWRMKDTLTLSIFTLLSALIIIIDRLMFA